MTVLVDDLVPDQLWALVEPLLPAPPRPPYGGRHRTISDRNCSPRSCSWPAPPPRGGCCPPARELGCGSPTTCWRRLTEWAKAGVFDALHLEVLDRLGEQGRLDWSRASVDTMSVRARPGGAMWAQIPSIVASQGASSSWSATVVGCRWRPSPPPTSTAPPCSRRSSTTSHRSVRRRAVGAPDRARSTPTGHTTAARTGRTCGVVGSDRESPGAGWSRRCGLGATAGGSSGRWRG
jgi:transposase